MNHQPIALYPYRLNAIAKEKIWGGRNLARRLHKPLAPDSPIGETWEAWDGCAIANGVHAGVTLGNLIERDAANLLGARTRQARLPLLFKFIDAQDDLSVQVHPNDAQAQVFEQYPFGKTEAWYILHAEPDARLYHGWLADVNAEQVRAALATNTLQDLIAAIPVQRDDVIFVPAGTVHAIGKGIVLAEIQENSDITYRLYDWGRQGKGRELHIEQSLRVIDGQPMPQHTIPGLMIQSATFTRRFLVACQYFCLERFDVHAPSTNIALGDSFNIISVISGQAALTFGQDFSEHVDAKLGETFLLPAQLGNVGITPQSTGFQMLRMYVPDLRADVITPLRHAGYPDDQIASLGGAKSQHNDLIAHIA